MSRQLWTGDEAVAWGAIQAGCSLSAAYPGTPASEIQEVIGKSGAGVPVYWCINEKVAYETALGASYANQRVLVSMKHVGLNVAMDSFMNSVFTGVNGGLVLAVGDDPSMYSSQNEQDSRLLAAFAKTFCLEPSDPQEAFTMTQTAFEISEQLHLPVLLRLVTRICYGEGQVETDFSRRAANEILLQHDRRRWVVVPSNARVLHKKLNARQRELEAISEGLPFNEIHLLAKKRGIIASGVAYAHVREHWNGSDSLLKIGSYPLPQALLQRFLEHCQEIIVVEEGEPLVERALARLDRKVHGKLDGTFPREWEMTPDLVAQALTLPYSHRPAEVDLPPRYPGFCAGCGYNRAFAALKRLAPPVVTGDIGCYSLAAFPPLEVIDTIVCMGASIGMALGLAYSGIKPVAVLGDSTFFHAGLPPMVDAVHNRADLLVLILDNEITAMTGGQPTPAWDNDGKAPVTLEEVLGGLGAPFRVFNPNRPEAELDEVFRQAYAQPGPMVLISRSPCLTEGKRRKAA